MVGKNKRTKKLRKLRSIEVRDPWDKPQRLGYHVHKIWKRLKRQGKNPEDSWDIVYGENEECCTGQNVATVEKH